MTEQEWQERKAERKWQREIEQDIEETDRLIAAAAPAQPHADRCRDQ